MNTTKITQLFFVRNILYFKTKETFQYRKKRRMWTVGLLFYDPICIYIIIIQIIYIYVNSHKN